MRNNMTFKTATKLYNEHGAIIAEYSAGDSIEVTVLSKNLAGSAPIYRIEFAKELALGLTHFVTEVHESAVILTPIYQEIETVVMEYGVRYYGDVFTEQAALDIYNKLSDMVVTQEHISAESAYRLKAVRIEGDRQKGRVTATFALKETSEPRASNVENA